MRTGAPLQLPAKPRPFPLHSVPVGPSRLGGGGARGKPRLGFVSDHFRIPPVLEPLENPFYDQLLPVPQPLLSPKLKRRF